MNQNQELKMRLLKEFGVSDEPKTIDFCREAYKFLVEGDLMRVVGVDAKTGEPIIERTAVGAQASTDITAVDLGLPSGKLWADRNLGAKSPEDYGAFVSWGNTDLHFPNKDNMDWGDDDEAFDYKFSSEEYKKTPGYKLEGNIDAEHDAATVNLGEPWCMPTEDDIQELYDNCIWTRKTLNGVNGYEVKSKINGNSIFLPCSGSGNGASWRNRGTYGGYWSSSLLSATDGRGLLFVSGGVSPQYSDYRFGGFAVRPVQTSFSKTK